MMESKTVSASECVRYEMVMPVHLNGEGRLFGGQLMSWADLAAGVAAHLHSEGPVLTAGCEVKFLAPAITGDLIKLHSRVVFAGTTSMEVLVRASRGETTIALARVTMVAVDGEGKPRKTPAVHPRTEGEKRDYLLAERRYSRRKSNG